MDQYKLLEIVAKHRYDMDLKRIDKMRFLEHKAHLDNQSNTFKANTEVYKYDEEHHTYMMKMIETNIGIVDLEMSKIALEIDHFNEKISMLNKK
jgi:hypothetical protein